MSFFQGLNRIFPGLKSRPLSYYGFGSRRNLSIVSIHRAFPATLYRFQTQRVSELYDRRVQKANAEVDDALDLSDDGMIYPGISTAGSNGALFMPNTQFMQELTRASYDYYVDLMHDGQSSAELLYLCIPKGTPIPSSLTLLRERDSRFSLQPSWPMSLSTLNENLTHFYNMGAFTEAGEWMEQHAYHEASDDYSEVWMNH